MPIGHCDRDALLTWYEREFPGSLGARFLRGEVLSAAAAAGKNDNEVYKQHTLKMLTQAVQDLDKDLRSGGDGSGGDMFRKLGTRDGLPDPTGHDVVVLHLRLGDVLDIADCAWVAHDNRTLMREQVENVFSRGAMHGCTAHLNRMSFIRPRAFYEALVEALPRGVTTAVLVGGSAACHTGRTDGVGRERSDSYIEKLGGLLERAGLRVVRSEHGSPDEDFVYLATARHLAVAGGGYGRLAGEVSVELRAGRDEHAFVFDKQPFVGTVAAAVAEGKEEDHAATMVKVCACEDEHQCMCLPETARRRSKAEGT